MNQAEGKNNSTHFADAMRRIFGIFQVKREERKLALATLLYSIALNALVVAAHWQWFSQVTADYRKLVLRHFHISGYDPITYLVLNEWSAGYNIYRHPLLAFLMWPLAQLNHVLMVLTGTNFAPVITALLLVCCTFYATLFLFRILREVVRLDAIDAHLLTFFFLSFGYTLVATSVPDHFCLSMAALLLTLYVAGRKLNGHKPYTKWQTVLFFLLTAGISLNNGVKVFLTNWLVNGKRFWRPANLLLAVIVPSALIWGFARWEWRTFEWPKYMARQEAKARKAEKERQHIALQLMEATREKDTTGIGHAADSIYQARAEARQEKKMKKALYAHQGKPIANGEFSSWTDVTTPRPASVVENLFGEPIQLHTDYVLGDVLVNRPVIVPYRYRASYAVEAFVVLFFLVGIWMGRRSRFLWLALSWMGFDKLIHLVLGFGLNEIYIMSPHWLFVLPIAMSFALQRLPRRGLRLMRATVALLAGYLLVYNGSLYVQYLFF